MKRRSQPRGKQAKTKSKESGYAAKQGRHRNKDGKTTGRTRYAKTSPFHPEHVTDLHHRLARVALPALQRSLVSP